VLCLAEAHLAIKMRYSSWRNIITGGRYFYVELEAPLLAFQQQCQQTYLSTRLFGFSRDGELSNKAHLHYSDVLAWEWE
jgi:hypothetical protein